MIAVPDLASDGASVGQRSMFVFNDNNVVVATFDRHAQAEDGTKRLKHGGFDLGELSIIGKDCPDGEQVVGYYTIEGRVSFWGCTGVFWRGLWDLLAGSALFVVPGIGPLVAAGPVVSAVGTAPEGGTATAQTSAMGAGLGTLGVAKDRIPACVASLKAGRLLVVVRGTRDEVARAEVILSGSGASDTQTHMAVPTTAVA